jgi:hypothetical protein
LRITGGKVNLRVKARQLILACVVSTIAIPVAAQKPMVFDVSNVVVGAQRIPTLALLASGKWSNAGDRAGSLSTEIHCYKSLGFCDVAHVFTTGLDVGDANVALDSFDILRWDSHEMIAVDSSEICIVSTIRVDLVTKRVTLSFSDKGVTKYPSCKGSDKLPTVVLWGSEDIANDAVNKAKSKK